MVPYESELEFARDLALKAGEIMVRNFQKSKISVKDNLTPVTETDIAISQMVINEVKETFPLHTVLDEEIQSRQGDNEYVWVCDPIDGTVPFSHHIPAATFSIALVKNGEPVVAVTYDPFIKRMLHTRLGTKTFLNDKEVAVRKEKLMPGDFIFGRPYWRSGVDANKYIAFLKNLGVRDFMVGSLVYEGMMVATGVVKAMVTIGANPWDRAAIAMLIENAGGKCTDEEGKRITVYGSPKFFVASNGVVHDTMIALIKHSKIE